MRDREKIVEVMARSDATFDGRLYEAMPRSDRERYKDRSSCALSALEAAGYVVVPREPTEAMLEAGNDARLPLGTIEENTIKTYRAMLAASKSMEG